MNSELLTSFSDAANQTFKLLLDLDVITDTVQSPENNDKKEYIENIDIVIQITGDLNGEIMYSFPKDMTLEMVKIMSGMEFKEIDEFVKSALGEIANIISGNALSSLSQAQLICDIRPPKVSEGQTFPVSEGCSLYGAKVKTSIGDVGLNLRTIQSAG
ncbi:chemotaxis protein CheX [Desulfosporosinus meridiei]|uniref:Putative inhibitor of MCP methylation, CheC n=1 Tax=Desulfosporosinus meridiei (strain ATCC BAA-275 / DSM 13257 / KCTC 12902 / NCIMB 13706 / S10) TaxID=768704 RepID=J7IR88_DESMD|nr:chemotaxis protein CheX [Desulfosporosinus meridiei]AFQ44342.1 putative inhibitor of MCP methylation, CheC [Desulfosporosinus meridiei DSM 13257]